MSRKQTAEVRRVLVTGAAGTAGQTLIPALVAHGFDVRATDLRLPDDTHGTDFRVADLRVYDNAPRLTEGVDAVVHLAGIPDPDSALQALLDVDVTMAVHLVRAAREHGVAQLVIASSLHVLGGYNWPRYWPIRPDWPADPCCDYGTVKAVIERLALTTAMGRGTRTTCLRMGWLSAQPPDKRAEGEWLSPRDFIGYVMAALTTPGGSSTFLALSANAANHWDLSLSLSTLGYTPQDDAGAFGELPAASEAYTTCRLWERLRTTAGFPSPFGE